jgi:two-component system NtrC family sensor kinase
VRYLIFGLSYLLVYSVAGWALRDHSMALSLFGNLGVIVSASIVIVTIVRRRRQWAGSQRLFWFTFAIGMAVWLVGHVGWAYGELIARHPSWLEWHTIFSLCGGLGPFIALVAAPHKGVRQDQTAAIGVNIASYGLLAGFLYSYFVLVPNIVGEGSEQALLVVVQVYRALLMMGMIVALIVGWNSAWRPVYATLAIGSVLGFCLRLITSHAIDIGTYRIGTLYDFAWITPFLCYAFAADMAPSSPEADEYVTDRPSTTLFAVMSATPVLIIPLIGYGAYQFQQTSESLGSFRLLLTGLATVAGLALLTLRLVVQRGELRRTDAQLRLLAAATEHTGDLIVITRADGSFEHANEAFHRAVGYSRRELSLMRFPQPVAAGYELLADMVTAEVAAKGLWRGTLHRRRHDGSTFPSAGTVVALKDRYGTATHYVNVERDVTDELRLRDQLVHSERLSAIGELVAGVAHELNNPLQTIVGSVELMLDDRSDITVSRHDLELVRREAGRAGHIMRNLLSFVRRTTPDRAAADLNHIVRQTAELREYHLYQRDVVLDMRCAVEPLPVLVNREEIQQVILNLLLNSEQAIDEGTGRGTITIRTSSLDGQHVVEVSDDGPGVRPHLRGRIFEPFFTTKDIGEGTGLGLSISHGIALAHGGTLTLRDAPSGATFRLSLPAHTPATRTTREPTPRPESMRRALVIEDEDPIRQLLVRFLERRGFDVRGAETGEAALALVPDFHPELVLCDVRMPGMSGIDLYRNLHLRDPEIRHRFVFITGDTNSIEDLEGNLSDVAVLAKPFTAADLDSVLKRFDPDAVVADV